MGEEITKSQFSKHDFEEYQARLLQETDLLKQWFAQGCFADEGPVAGFEVEAYLINCLDRPAPVNEAFLERVNSPLVVPELAQFNIEINTRPLPLNGAALTALRTDLARTWQRCNEAAQEFKAELLMIGILPTLREGDLTLANMSSMTRFRAINEQVFRLRRNKPITLDIRGRDHLHTQHCDVMLEAAATSFQIHLQVSQAQSVRFYNAAVMLSAPMVAVTANSPYLFGRDLWDETRIPLFEQAVGVPPKDNAQPNRVSLGSGYLRESIMECFVENLKNYAVLLPTVMDEPATRLSHLRLQNGTIWRWNRPLVGFNEDGTPHLRIEHRVVPAGPSLVDTLANAALFFGLVHTLGTLPTAPESALTFKQANTNFYAAAKDGLRSSIVWLDGKQVPIKRLLLETLLPLARYGLEALDLSKDDIQCYLGIIEERLNSGQNGAAWQRAYIKKHGENMQRLTSAYRERQREGAPVYEWIV